MGKVGKDEDALPVKMEKKSKKSKKNRTNDLLDVGDGNGHVEVDGRFPKEKRHKHREKQRKSESNEDADVAQHENGNLEDNVVFQKKGKKKRKIDSSENNRLSEKAQIQENEQGWDDDPAAERDCNPKPRKENKRKHKHHDQDRKLENDRVFSSVQISDGEEKRVYDEVGDGKISSDKDITVIKDVLGATKKNTERGENKSDAKGKKKIGDGEGIETSWEDYEGDMFEKIDRKKKKKNKTDGQNSDAEMHEMLTVESGKEGSTLQDEYLVDGEDGKGEKKKSKSVENNSKERKAKDKSKRVSFSSHVEVFPPSDTHAEKQKTKEDDLVRGKRFTPEEDAIVKEAVLNYIAAHDLGDEGLKMVLNNRSYPGMKKCWQEIGTCIPYRPYTAVYYRAHILFERAEERSWTPEEIEFLKEFQEKHGNKWKMVAEELGKHRFHVKDTWRRIKLKNQKGGRWSQEEYQNLYDLVNLDLRMKVTSQEKKSKHGMLRDNIPWGAISDKLSTRSDATCCIKWYNQLTSSLVAEKKWSDADDYRLIGVLYELDAACLEDVDWDNLLEHRPGDICRKRWDQMVLHIGHHGSKPFSEQVDTLAKRYCPDLAETREAWDNKPVVP